MGPVNAGHTRRQGWVITRRGVASNTAPARLRRNGTRRAACDADCGPDGARRPQARVPPARPCTRGAPRARLRRRGQSRYVDTVADACRRSR
eukprot:386768-Prymnesium_polylepis.1